MERKRKAVWSAKSRIDFELPNLLKGGENDTWTKAVNQLKNRLRITTISQLQGANFFELYEKFGQAPIIFTSILELWGRSFDIGYDPMHPAIELNSLRLSEYCPSDLPQLEAPPPRERVLSWRL